ncbi:MAG: helix-turn-helix domain-containing protein [Sphingomonadaceae bacterium]
MTERAQPVLVNVNDACRMIGCGRVKLYQLLAQEHIRAVKLGSRTLIRVDSIRALPDRLAAWSR